jgi:hypothetical protein
MKGNGPAVTLGHASLTFIRFEPAIVSDCRAEGCLDARLHSVEGAVSPFEIAMRASIHSGRGGCPAHQAAGSASVKNPLRTSCRSIFRNGYFQVWITTRHD